MTMQKTNDKFIEALNSFYGPNAGYALELYERYQQDPSSVDPATRAFFDNWQTVAPDQTPAYSPAPVTNQAQTMASSASTNPLLVTHVAAATALAHAIRERGHLGAHLDPLGTPPMGDPALQPEYYGITDADLAQLPASIVGGHAAEGAANAYEAIQRVREMYSGTISYQFDQVKGPAERAWLRDAVGLALFEQPIQPEGARALLRRLTEVEAFERFLHTTFTGQKRFSIEGTDALVPMLDEIVEEAANTGTHEVLIGMAHRGRLNVLAHVLGKPYSAIISEFMHGKHNSETAVDSTYGGWTGDVKYHLGAEQVLDNGDKTDLKIKLSPNPSHLEFVNPVVQGMTRAAQENREQPGKPVQDFDCAIPVLIHGDAAFPGEGIVAETMNLWRLRGYTVGGTIHIIANNQIGFTTEPQDGRSTYFASDLAKGFEIPIIHVNADDPEICLQAVRLAKAYRDRFHKDIMVDLIGYRRWGHNEGDEPAFTQPQLYEEIRKHPTVREIYSKRLADLGIIGQQEADNILKEVMSDLEEAKRKADGGDVEGATEEVESETEGDYQRGDVPQSVSVQRLTEFNQALLEWPRGFSPNSKLARLLQRRATTLGPEGGIDWGQAEALAFASILADGTAVRLTGQDAERGTFSHRHAVLHDQNTGQIYTPLQHLPQAKASFAIYNSPISEAAVMGFEYGYSVYAEDALVLWEAQFGDFANVAQVIIDQFIASGRAKWRQKSGLVLLLPHGYEGQGPEHSSARPERYLALSAGQNWRVANCSTSGQYFHLLRKQAFELRHDPRPLVIFTPKSLLRNPNAGTTLQELAEGQFQAVIDDPLAQGRKGDIRRVVLATGKIAIDLLSHESRKQADDVAVVKVEMLYPFPAGELTQILANYPNMQELIWVQEEPRNMGYWRYISPRLRELVETNVELRVIARPEQSSPATGFLDRYQMEQEQIITSALSSTIKEYGGTHVR
ncbi:MAG TPA: 2-oxoglutarate dehydrogenase E1 component [Chloroflexia bacterium]|nr:2-oxoglutarate dehydrogenase E1 component [Chloroflexia bacterium]